MASQDFPSYKIYPHKTLFGGVKDEIVVVEILAVKGLPSPIALLGFVQSTLPQLDIETLESLLYFQAIYVSRIQMVEQPAVEGSRRFNRIVTRQHQMKARGVECVPTPLTTHRLPRLSIKESVIPRGTRKVRFHLRPLRFPVASEIQWKSRLVWEDELFLVVDAPAGLPCQPVASNNVECLHQQLNQYFNIESIQALHRIDLWATGLVCLAKTPEAVRLFNSWQQENKVKKFYRLLVAAPATDNAITPSQLVELHCGYNRELIHWMPGGAANSSRKMNLRLFG